MIVYHLVNGFTGQRREQVYPTTAPGWARRPEPVSWAATFNVRSDPRETAVGVGEGNPGAGLQDRITPWVDVLAVSWQDPAGGEITLAAGIVSSPLTIDEEAGTLTVDTVCMRTLMEDRFLLNKTAFPPKDRKVTLSGFSWQGIVSEIVRIACRDYEPPDLPDYTVRGFDLPIDRPPATTGGQEVVWWGYTFKTAAEALEDVEEEAGLVVDFRPYWRSTDSRLRWNLEVFSDAERAATIVDLGSTGAGNPQAVYSGTTIDSSEMATVTHQTGKGSEVDILYSRKSDTTPTVMAREKLIARPDVETNLQLVRQAEGIYADAREVLVQDSVTMRVDPTEPDWADPRALWVGRTVQVTLEGSLAYGHATLRRTLIGWQASGENAVTLELQDLGVDAGV